jgi:hypothetical protein
MLRVLSERRQQRIAFGRLWRKSNSTGSRPRRRCSVGRRERRRPAGGLTTRPLRGARLARKPRICVVEEEQARSIAEIEALADRLPVTAGPLEVGVPVDFQVSIRDQARDLLHRDAATPEEADRLWEPLPSWRRQWAPSQLPDVRGMRAVAPDCRAADDFSARTIGRTGRSPRA